MRRRPDSDGAEDPGPLFRRQVPPERLDAAEAAAQHADRDAGDDWQGQASALLLRWARLHAEFTSEQALAYALAAGLPEPPDRRAWGGIVAGASQRGQLVRVRFDLDKYGSPKPVWRLNRATPW